jgi:hypothetical protein
MAYTPSPENQTYSTHRIPLAQPIRLRVGNNNWVIDATDSGFQGQDAGMINILPVKYPGSEEAYGLTRPSIEGVAISSTETGLVRGMYVWEKTLGTVYYFVVCGVKVYTSTDAETWTHVDTLLTSVTTPVRFSEFISATNVKSLILVDGVEGYVYTTNAAGTKITDVDFPTPHIAFPVFLNGRLYLAKSETGDIYNSALNDPAAWSAGDFIGTEVYADDIQALIKLDNYLLAIGTQSCEFFHDAANAIGSPLARNEGLMLAFGTQFPNSIAVNKNVAVFLANTSDGQAVFKVIESGRARNIESSSIVPMMNRMMNNPDPDYQFIGRGCRGMFFRHAGELYYGFMFNGVRNGIYQQCGANLFYAFSFNANMWTELQFGEDLDREVRYVLPVKFASYNTTNRLTCYVSGNVDTDGRAYFGTFQDNSGNDSIPDVYDDDIPIYQETRTPNLDFDTSNRKAMHRLAIDIEVADSPTSPVDYSISWNDNDYAYASWTDARTLSSDTGGDWFPMLTQLGTFRRRALRIVTTAGKILRWKAVEVDINKGQQ